MWQLQWDELAIERAIGRGSFGAVYRARWQETTVAVKVLIDRGTLCINLLLDCLVRTIVALSREACWRQPVPTRLLLGAWLPLACQRCCIPTTQRVPCSMRPADRMSHNGGLELPDELMRALDEEAGVMIRMRHPNVVQV